MIKLIDQETVAAVRHDAGRLRELVAEQRARLREDHERRRCGPDTVAGLSALMDAVVTSLYRGVVAPSEVDRPGSGCAVVAVGGYGRGELFPASDVDVMFLFDPPAHGEGLAVSKGVLHALWDLGYAVGHSVRRIRDCLDLSRGDATIRTALLEARWLAGDRRLFEEFEAAFASQLRKDLRPYIAQKLAEREAGYERYGSTVYLLEPDLKKSKGGLRDLHYIGWLARAVYGASSWQELVQAGVLTDAEHRDLVEARDFLWVVRNEMHFYAGKAGDVLTFDEQVRLAGFFGFEDGPQLLGVERFMQQYYRLSTSLHQTSNRFLRRLQRPTRWRRLVTAVTAREIQDRFVVTRNAVLLPERRREALAADPDTVIGLFAVAQEHGRPIAESTLDAVYRAASDHPEHAYAAPAIQRRVFSLFRAPGIGRTLEAMHRVGILERVLPEFASARGLMQFNQYHKFTVDVHSLRAVQAACALAESDGALAAVYRDIHRKDLLHLALLLHDIGKGKGGDHSQIGEDIAVRVADRLAFNAHEREVVTFLVRHHLLMSHIAFRRDLSDDKVLVRFARQVGQPELLQMFLVFTYADITAVGPGTWTAWKHDLLHELYSRAMDALAGGRVAGDASARRRAEAAVRDLVGDRLPALWLHGQFEAMPDRYFLVTPPEQIVRHLELVYRLPPDGVLVDTRWDADQQATELTVATFDSIIPGLFSKLAGTLAALGLQILGAQVFTRLDGVVVDTFRFQDPDYAGEPPSRRVNELKRTLGAVVMGKQRVEELFTRGTRLPRVRLLPHGTEPTQVEIDNETSDGFTIIDVFATDVQGLLYVITRTLFELGLSIHSSKIATRIDQIVDVFYVQDPGGGKIVDSERLAHIKRTLTQAVDAYVAAAAAGRGRPVAEGAAT
ncbi:MAG: [protein-PII] uridylyltransferase [Nitrospirota bacterium]